MSRNTALLSSTLVVCVLSLVGCDDKPAAPTPVVTTPTPTPTPAPAPTPAPTPPPEPAALDSLTLNPSTVRSQGRPVATVALTAAAPAGGAVVLLSSSNVDAARVPSGMTVQAGEKSGTFTVDVATVPVLSTTTIEATYAGVTKTAVLTVTPPPLEARFIVGSPTRGLNNDACDITDAFGSIDCQLDATTSDGFIARYIWTLRVGSKDLTISTGGPTLVPTTTCADLSGGSVSSGAVSLGVFLQLEDRQQNRSSTTQRTVALYHNGRCGY